MDRFSVIITAGGTSSRFGERNKLLEKIKDKTVIEETVDKFINIKEIDEIIIPTNKNIKSEFKKLFNNEKIKIIDGGSTRQQSVYKGLQEVKNEFVLIHDGARPLVTQKIIKDAMDKTVKYNAVSVMTKTIDTIKEVDEDGKIIRTIDRSKLYNTQTPQGFRTSLIKSAHEKLIDGNYTDDCSMLEELQVPVYIVEGSYTNIKITVKNDLDFAKIYI